MGSVDAYIREAHRTYANTERKNRLWKVVFTFLLHMAIYNSFCLYMWTAFKRTGLGFPKLKRYAQREFRLRLAEELSAACRSERFGIAVQRRYKRKSVCNELQAVLYHQHKHYEEVEGGKKGECAQCRRANPGAHNVKQSVFMCAGCGVNLCLRGNCFEEYHISQYSQYQPGQGCSEPEISDLEAD